MLKKYCYLSAGPSQNCKKCGKMSGMVDLLGKKAKIEIPG
jgi:hypothetical protein